MQVHNLHERIYDCDADSLGALVDSLASSEDRLWPRENWPPMRLDSPLRVGARGGHGPIHYQVEQYIPRRKVLFRFLAPRGFKGAHGFEIEHQDGRTILRHILQMETSGPALLSWPLVFRPLHDALIEDALDKASVSLGCPVGRVAGWSVYVRMLRVLFKAVKRSNHLNVMKLRPTTPNAKDGSNHMKAMSLKKDLSPVCAGSNGNEAYLPPVAWTRRLIAEFDAADQKAQELVTGLSPEQLNWQPRPGAWSVGQCLEHLCVFNELYLSAIASSLKGKPTSAAQEITPGWFSRWFLKNYIEPCPQTKRAPAPKKTVPGTRVNTSVLDRFLRSNRAARELVGQAADYDVNRIRYRNPFVPILRFTVGTGLEIVSKHERRHLLQAERAKRSSGLRS